MARFGAKMTRTASLTLGVGQLTNAAASPRRFAMHDLIFGSDAAPTDASFLHEVSRVSTAGTAGTNVTPAPADFSDTIASTVVCGQAMTANGTAVANSTCLSIPVNSRATVRWAAVPGDELVTPATALHGFVFNTPTATVLQAVEITARYNEL